MKEELLSIGGFTPRQVKLAVVGEGTAEKDRVWQ
ncbi:crossover junction endodeoxyribonuclease RuvC [uncultured Slackia sp.]|nr:crossover junction endodeoxyribonuclease RuvC [uncultured Slackia sp.]